MTRLTDLKKDLRQLARPADAKILQRFFKTGPGEYGAGDVFLGIKVPPLRVLAKKYTHLSFADLQKLLNSKIHEERETALMILVLRFRKAGEKEQKQIYQFYLTNLKAVNNWDLVDSSCRFIMGPYLETRDRKVLYRLARSKDLWQKRVAMITTYYFIHQDDYADALKLAKILLHDEHDLIQKAVGWMLREIGDQDLKTELQFLDRHAATMPRTCLRYAIEKLPSKLRLQYMKAKN